MKQGTRVRKRPMLAVLLAATALISPQAASAQTARETELEARLNRLESEMAALRADLAATRDQQARTSALADAAAAKSDATATKVAAIESKPQPEGMRSGATTIKIGGYIKLLAANSTFSEGEVATNSLGRDFYLPQAIPVGTGPSSTVQDFTAKQSRFWLNLSTDLGKHKLKGYVEVDFQTSPGTQGSQRTTNGYNLALRRAYMQLDRWTFGQDWTTFQYTGALPESTDYVGGSEGTVFVRQPLIRYSAPLSKQLTLNLAIENPEGASANAGSPTLIENGDDRVPDFAARLAYTGKRTELSLGGLLRKVRVANGGVAADTTGYGASAAGKLFLNGAKTSDVRFMVTYGRNISRYVGLNFAPDAVYVAATNRLEDVDVFAAIGAVRFALTPQLRLNVMGSYQSVDYSSNLAAASIASFNQRAWSGAVNLFYSPAKNVDLGIEYRHGERRLVNGLDGSINRIEFAAKYGF